MNPRVLSLVILATVAVAVIVVLVLRGGNGDEQAPGADVGFEVLDAGCGYENVVTAQQTIPPSNDEFCLIRVTVTNRGETAASLSPECQFLVSTTGERYAPRTDILAVDSASRAAFQAPIGPGQVIEDAGLYYDVAGGTKPATAEFHSVCDGEPTTVDL
jgi:hypothetical protein